MRAQLLTLLQKTIALCNIHFKPNPLSRTFLRLQAHLH